jgi:dTDP-4-amino-4,6-dideoxygalactose transaminase
VVLGQARNSSKVKVESGKPDLPFRFPLLTFTCSSSMPASMRIPAADLRAQHDALRDELMEAFQRVLHSSAFVLGPELEAFEREFAAYCEVAHALGVANGTDALALALRALGVGPGDSVALPALTFVGTAEAVCHVGARPLLVDIEPQTCTLDPAALRDTLQRHGAPVRAVIPVHLYGQAAAMDEIVAVAHGAGAAIVEDAAQAHGARYRGRRAGGLGVLGCFSFYPSKNLGALGDGGAITTNDAALATRVALLRDHGQPRKYVHDIVGFTSRLDGLQAAWLRVKLRRLEQWNARRRALARLYDSALRDVPGMRLPDSAPEREHVYHLYVIRCRERDALRAHLEACGIAAGLHYPRALHLQPAFAHLGYRAGDFPEAEAAAREVLALPLYPELNDAAAAEVGDAVHAWATRVPATTHNSLA